jgi:hypothetical protein
MIDRQIHRYVLKSSWAQREDLYASSEYLSEVCTDQYSTDDYDKVKRTIERLRKRRMSIINQEWWRRSPDMLENVNLVVVNSLGEATECLKNQLQVLQPKVQQMSEQIRSTLVSLQEASSKKDPSKAGLLNAYSSFVLSTIDDLLNWNEWNEEEDIIYLLNERIFRDKFYSTREHDIVIPERIGEWVQQRLRATSWSKLIDTTFNTIDVIEDSFSEAKGLSMRSVDSFEDQALYRHNLSLSYYGSIQANRLRYEAYTSDEAMKLLNRVYKTKEIQQDQESFKKYVLPYYKLHAELSKLGIFDLIWFGPLVIAVTNPVIAEFQEKSIEQPVNHLEPYLKFSNGESYYRYNEINLDTDSVEDFNSGQLAAEKLLSIRNIEQRHLLLKAMGAERVIEELDAKLTHRSLSGNELYKIPRLFNHVGDAYYLKYTCPSTGRVYVSGVPPRIGKKRNADTAMAWKFGLTVEEYRGIESQS